jgi:hypothetical protein
MSSGRYPSSLVILKSMKPRSAPKAEDEIEEYRRVYQKNPTGRTYS